ncbi:hypothetical protein [Streptosporangium saharense]|uniref:hypothetical protein n=1 Tax=Streptosporangium saharense TaxID=1706840 RepID=UPI00332AC076
MRRVAVVGCGGGGKSHLAREPGRVLDLPVTHLDALHYDDASPERFAAVRRDLVG